MLGARGEEVAALTPLVTAANGMVVAQEPPCGGDRRRHSEPGGERHRCGGRGRLSEAVTYPCGGNMGGGGFIVVHRADGNAIVIDFRETAPAADDPRRLYLDASRRRRSPEARASTAGAPSPRQARFSGFDAALKQKYGADEHNARQGHGAGDRAGARRPSFSAAPKGADIRSSLSRRASKAITEAAKIFLPVQRFARSSPAIVWSKATSRTTLQAIAGPGPETRFIVAPIAEEDRRGDAGQGRGPGRRPPAGL